mgnify:CR=1 FL=1
MKTKRNEYICVYCEEPHENEFSLTCATCDKLRESEGLEVEDDEENLLPPKRLR